jgi:3'(2'), 5'-bisphosphate nucleotidase/myo-inositol-1(or 4)-monophosphatase
MFPSHEKLANLCELAISAAQQAGQYIAGVDRQSPHIKHKKTGTSLAAQVVTEVDRHCDQLIRKRLLPSCKELGFGLLTEETEDSCERLTTPYFWCVDPLDGTLPFIEGRPGYAVSIALVSQAGEPILGVIYDPVNGDTFSAQQNHGAFKNNQKISIRPNKSSEALCVFADNSFKDQPNFSDIESELKIIAQQFGANNVEIIYGSGAVKNACQILDQPLACYFKPPKSKAGGGSLWDFAASACLVREAGGWVSNMAGDPLDLNRADSTFMNHQGVLYASNKALADALMASTVIARAGD